MNEQIARVLQESISPAAQNTLSTQVSIFGPWALWTNIHTTHFLSNSPCAAIRSPVLIYKAQVGRGAKGRLNLPLRQNFLSLPEVTHT